MPYKTTQDLPSGVQHVLPSHAQDIYKETYNSALTEYKNSSDKNNDDLEATAARVAWAAVKSKYKKTGPGKWTEK